MAESLSTSGDGAQNIGESRESSRFSADDPQVLIMSVRELNKGLSLIGTSPIKKDKMRQKRYSSDKLKNITEALQTKVFNIPHDDTESNEDEDEDDETCILQTLKERYNTTEDRTIRIRILTIFNHWSFRKIKQHFEATNQMIIVAKKNCRREGNFIYSKS